MRHDENNFEEVGELLGALKRVEPPGDFDMRVRGRIAQGRPATSRRWPMAVARIGVPAAVLIALGGYFGWTNLNEPVNVPLVVETQGLDPIPTEVSNEVERADSDTPNSFRGITPQDEMVREPQKNMLAERMQIAPDNRTSPAGNRTFPDTSEPGEGSLDFSFPTARRRLPRGFDPDRLITNTNISATTRQSAVDVLRMLGVAASCSASGCRVNSVSSNGVAGNSGLKAGEVIESIDGTPINSSTTFGGQFSASSVRVRRGGSVLTISLRP